MKKIIALILTLMTCFSFTACFGGGNKKAFKVSKEAYDKVSIAYDITEKFGSDIYEAWRLGIYDDEEILEDGVSYLAKELYLSEDELKEGLGRYISRIVGENWDEMSEDQKDIYRENTALYLKVVEDDLFSYCIDIVVEAYIANGKVEEAQTALDSAKSLMRELSEKHSDYEHYPNLKGYYTTTSSFFDFCQNPTGSFEQVKGTLNDYKNEARDLISDLDYIFEE